MQVVVLYFQLQLLFPALYPLSSGIVGHPPLLPISFQGEAANLEAKPSECPSIWEWGRRKIF